MMPAETHASGPAPAAGRVEAAQRVAGLAAPVVDPRRGGEPQVGQFHRVSVLEDDPEARRWPVGDRASTSGYSGWRSCQVPRGTSRTVRSCQPLPFRRLDPDRGCRDRSSCRRHEDLDRRQLDRAQRSLARQKSAPASAGSSPGSTRTLRCPFPLEEFFHAQPDAGCCGSRPAQSARRRHQRASGRPAPRCRGSRASLPRSVAVGELEVDPRAAARHRVRLQIRWRIALSGVIHGPPDIAQPGQFCIVNRRPSRCVSSATCAIMSSHAGLRHWIWGSTPGHGRPLP